MEQQKLEEKVRELFERQGFKLEKEDNVFRASKGGKRMVLRVFSSDEYSSEDVGAEPGDKVFVDEGLSEVELENDVSVLREDEDEPEYDTPSYEVIGDIAVINDLAGVEREEAIEGILHHQNVKTILLKEGGLKGEFRVGDYEVLHGEETETEHTEFGCRYRLDPTEVYFSERFSTERKRVVDQIEDGEKAMVMFAGVGPFAVLAAREADPSEVVAIEKNPVGADYLKENIGLNSVVETVRGLEGDVEEIVPDLGKFDRIVMPLPESAQEFLDLAFEHTEDNAVIHYYRFVEEDVDEPILDEISDAADKTGRGYEIIGRTVCGERGPGIERVCFDILVSSGE